MFYLVFNKKNSFFIALLSCREMRLGMGAVKKTAHHINSGFTAAHAMA